MPRHSPKPPPTASAFDPVLDDEDIIYSLIKAPTAVISSQPVFGLNDTQKPHTMRARWHPRMFPKLVNVSLARHELSSKVSYNTWWVGRRSRRMKRSYGWIMVTWGHGSWAELVMKYPRKSVPSVGNRDTVREHEQIWIVCHNNHVLFSACYKHKNNSILTKQFRGLVFSCTKCGASSERCFLYDQRLVARILYRWSTEAVTYRETTQKHTRGNLLKSYTAYQICAGI